VESLLAARLDALRGARRFRDPSDSLRERASDAAAALRLPLIHAASNDYLGLAASPLPHPEAPSGAGASRLVHGTHDAHSAFERELAEWLGTEAALLFSSGYAANVGALQALAEPTDRILSDSLNHASIVDGCRLSRAHVAVLPHRSLPALAAALAEPWPGQTWVVTEAYFSMDGDSPDLSRVAALCTEHSAALLVDEAHSLGTFGPAGRGLCAAAGVVPDVLVGTLGKAFGLHGAFVAGSHNLYRWLWNRARSFAYSTATSPAQAAEGRARLSEVRSADARRARLAQLVDALAPVAQRFDPPPGRHGPVFPLIVGEETRALALAEHCAAHGILVQAIRPPTVPAGGCRVRLSLNADMSDADVARIQHALEAF
jgi:8-amino-7-oxononanoate synthase